MTGSRPTEPQAELGDGSSVVSCVCPRNAAKPASEAEESAAHHRMVVEPEDLVDEGQRRYGSFPTNVARNLAPILSGPAACKSSTARTLGHHVGHASASSIWANIWSIGAWSRQTVTKRYRGIRR
jgi:hypothetical protein